MKQAAATFLEAFQTLQQEGLGYVDAGARDGVHAMFQEMAPLLHVVGFEPDGTECQRLNTASGARWRSLTYLPCGLGERDAEQSLHLCRSRGTSSFYQPNQTWLDRFPDSQRYEVVETQAVRVRSLDSLRRDPAVRMPSSIDFIKLDIQGAELDALKGSQETLRQQVIGVEVEVEFAPLYEGQPLFRDVDAYLAGCGFSLFKLRRKSWVRRNSQARPQVSAGQLIAGDALYLRDPLERGRAESFAWSAHQVEAVVLLATLYDLNDFALEILADPVLSQTVNAKSIARAIEERGHRLDYRVNGNGWLASAAGMARECLKGRAGLGNVYAWALRRSWGRADSDKDFYTRTSPR